MHASLIWSITLIIVLAVSAQWIAWRIGLPSILVLLVIGLVAGPGCGWISPDEVFGELLLPLVSLAVALILYEGGLSLRLADVPKIGGVVRNLTLLGGAITWILASLAAWLIIGLPPSMALLMGALVIVTGPTVIAPLLRFIRPLGQVGPILRWEGIVIDPVGALLTILVFEAIQSDAGEASRHVVVGVLSTIVVGGGLGAAAALILALAMARRWMPDHLEVAASLSMVVAVFTLSNSVQHEAGLLAVTVMGFVLANQKWVEVERIVEFKESLVVLLIATLFILLAARLEFSTLSTYATSGVVFAIFLVVVVRPLGVLASTWRSDLSTRERVFLAWMAPRGIVAAAVASVLAMRLQAAGFPGADALVSVTFITIIVTVAVYGLTAPMLARRLGVSESNPQGILIVGAHAAMRKIGLLLKAEGYRVLLVDSNQESVRAARMAGLETYSGSILGEHTVDKIELGGIGRLFAATPNDWVNVLAVQRFVRVFGRHECYQLAPQGGDSVRARHQYLHGKLLFDGQPTYAELNRLDRLNYVAKMTGISEAFDYHAYRNQYGDDAIPLLVIEKDGGLRVVTADAAAEPEVGEKLISLVREQEPD